MMERQVEHLVRLIDDLMDVSRIARQRLELRRKRLDLRTVVDSAAEANDVRIAQVLSNLLVNASKYSSPGSEVQLALQRAAGSALIEVKDEGIGLALTRRLVEMHGGRAWAESAGKDQGSSFFVELPLAQAEPSDGAPYTGPKTSATPSARPRRVLIADDNVEAAQALGTALAMAGHEVRTASNGEGALQAAASFVPDVVLLDIGMPGLSGYDVARRLRQEPSLCAAYLVALTGWGSREDQQRALQAGFDVHVTKPASAEHIEYLIAGCRGAAS
jgi:CheY-like chemotaxis protein